LARLFPQKQAVESWCTFSPCLFDVSQYLAKLETRKLHLFIFANKHKTRQNYHLVTHSRRSLYVMYAGFTPSPVNQRGLRGGWTLSIRYFVTVFQQISTAIKLVADDILKVFQQDVYCVFVSKGTHNI